MSHLKFNVVLARVLIKKGTSFTPNATTMIGASVLNPKDCNGGINVVLFYAMTRTSKRKKFCVVCKKQMNWYCPTCDDTIVCFGACFVK
jgi:hypothetical protein